MSRKSIDLAEWLLRSVAKADEEGRSDSRTWATCWEESYRELGGCKVSVGRKPCSKNAAYGLWLLGRIKGTGRAWQNISVCDVNREMGKNAAYAVIAVDVLADGTNRNTRQLWEQVKHLYAAVTGELPAINQQGQISLVLALARRGLLAMGRCVVTADKATTK